jgi:hypothetical protein
VKNKIKALIIFGTLIWSLTMVKSGLNYSFGMGFWGPNGHDGVWHIALIESLARGSFDMPVFAGETLKNYHLGFDLIVAFLNRITTIPVSILYFQIIPPILAFLVGFLTYKLVLSWRKSDRSAFWATFFVYFGGSLGWILTLLKSGEIGGESTFWSQQGISTLINPPFAFSLVLMLAGLILLLTKKKLWLVAIIFGILIQIKAYAGILTLGGLLLSAIYQYWGKREMTLLKVFLGTFVTSLVLFLPFNATSGRVFFFKPFWFLETMMGLSDRVGWERFYSAMTNYRLGNVWIKAIPAYLVAFAIFWIGNMGTRLLKGIAVLKWLKNFKSLGWVEFFVMGVIIAGGIIPMLFLQMGTPWNTIQFFYYSLFFSAILAGIAMGEFIKKSFLVSFLVVIFTIPTTIGTLRHYLPSRPPAMISTSELEALKALAKEPEGVVLTVPFDKQKALEAESNPPRPLSLYESTAYVSAFSRKPVYIEDEVNLDITGYPWGERKLKVAKFLNSLDITYSRNFLRENHISYVYFLKGQRALLGEGQLGLTKIFENEAVDIYKVE